MSVKSDTPPDMNIKTNPFRYYVLEDKLRLEYDNSILIYVIYQIYHTMAKDRDNIITIQTMLSNQIDEEMLDGK